MLHECQRYLTRHCLLVFILAVLGRQCAVAEKVLVQNPSYLQLDFLHIKTPQLIGIIAGCVVFTVTIGTVLYLLYASGTLTRALAEIATDPKGSRKAAPSSPQFTAEPMLYDHLLAARSNIPLLLNVPLLAGKQVLLRLLAAADLDEAFQASCGQAVFHESAYDPQRIWGWSGADSVRGPWTSPQAFAAHLQQSAGSGAQLVVVDKEFKRIIGMICLVDNRPADLTIRIGSMWITPAFQGSGRSHEALFLAVKWLVDTGYRRICAEVDERHVIARKFLARSGFLLEAVLRKHRIVQDRNSNSALYVMLNSDFQSIEDKLRTALGLQDANKTVRVAALSTAIDRSQLQFANVPEVARKKKQTKRRDKSKKQLAELP